MSSQSDNQDTDDNKVSFINRIIYTMRDSLDCLKERTRLVILNLESHKSFELYGLYVVICLLSIITTIKFDWLYFAILSIKVLVNVSDVGFAPMVLAISVYLFSDISIYLSIPHSLISEILDLSIPCILYYSMLKLGFIKDFKFEFTFVLTALFLSLQIIIEWLSFFMQPLSAVIKFITHSILSSNSIVKADSLYNRRELMFLIMNERRDFGDGFTGFIKLWIFEFNKIIASHCTTSLIFLVLIYIFSTVKSNFEYICSIIGIMIPRSPIITIKDLFENSVELYWNEPIEHYSTLDSLKGAVKLIGHYIAYPFKRYGNKSSTSSKAGVDNTLSDLISISKHHGENTYHFSLNNKDTTNNNLKFPKSTSINNFRTTHYDKEIELTDFIQDVNSDSNQSLDPSEEKENKNKQQNSDNDKTNKKHKTTSSKFRSE